MNLHPDTIKRGMRCNWKGQPERLIYLRKFNGWHQFQKIGDPRPVWCEVLDADLHMLEETKDDDALQPCGHPKSLVLHSAESGEPLYCETCDDKSGRRDAELRESELAAANAALRKRIAEFENEAREQALQALASEGQWIEHTGAQQKRIAELEAQRVPQWISVTERLPEKFVEVLVCFDGQSTLCATGQYTDNHRHDVAGWCYPAENRGCTDSGDDPVVTHWMPLPPPPVERAHGIEGGETHNVAGKRLDPVLRGKSA